MNLKFGSSLVKLRKEKNLTQKQVADSIFVCRSTYAAWEANKNEITFTHVFRLINFYEISINDLLVVIENENNVQILRDNENTFIRTIMQEIEGIKNLLSP